MDTYEEVRNLPLYSVLHSLGVFHEWKPRKGGLELGGKCPFHQAKKNMTSFNFVVATGAFHCFSCGAKGKGAIDAVMRYRDCSFKDAIEYLKGLQLKDTPPNLVVEDTRKTQVSENQPFKGSYDKYYVPSEWLAKRGISPEALKHFDVGQYDNPARQSVYKDKILLPVRRMDGELVAYLARNPETNDQPKYIWPKGFNKHLELFGAWQIKNEARNLPIRFVYLVESPFCVMKFWQLGFPAVSPFGCSVSSEQVELLCRLARGIVFLPDRDKYNSIQQQAGILSQKLWTKCSILPDGISDPEHLDASQIRALA